MNCKTCNYALWNLAPGPCPECGTVFRPSDFRLTSNACQFICPTPGCRQDYYGTDDAGHLVPRAFVCVKCAQPIDMDAMLLLPTRGVDERITQQDGLAWAERKKRGLVRAFFATCAQSVGNPAKMGRGVLREMPNAVAAMVFAGICTFVAGLVGIGLMFGWVSGISQISRLGVQARWIDWLEFAAVGVAWGVLPGLAVLLALQVWGACTHVLLVMMARGVTWVDRQANRPPDPKNEEPLSMSRTIEFFNYSAAPVLLIAVPCVGWLASPAVVVWVWLTAAFAMAQQPATPVGRVLLAGAVLPVMAVAGFIVVAAIG